MAEWKTEVRLLTYYVSPQGEEKGGWILTMLLKIQLIMLLLLGSLLNNETC